MMAQQIQTPAPESTLREAGVQTTREQRQETVRSGLGSLFIKGTSVDAQTFRQVGETLKIQDRFAGTTRQERQTIVRDAFTRIVTQPQSLKLQERQVDASTFTDATSAFRVDDSSDPAVAQRLLVDVLLRSILTPSSARAAAWMPISAPAEHASFCSDAAKG